MLDDFQSKSYLSEIKPLQLIVTILCDLKNAEASYSDRGQSNYGK